MLGIAFEGCACRAAFHAGVAAALAEAKLPIAIAAGASSGSLAAAGVALGAGPELPDRWRALAGRSIVSLRRTLWNRSPFDMSHLVRGAVEDLLRGRDIAASPIEAVVTATRARDLRRVVFSSRDEPDFLAALLGSCFFPVLYGRAVRIGGALLLDGGLTDNLPVEELAARGATEIIAVVIDHAGTAFKRPFTSAWRPSAPGAKVHVIHPERRLELRSWELDADKVARAIDAGYARGRAFTGA